MSGFEFKNPLVLWLLIPLVLSAFVFYKYKIFSREPSIPVSSATLIKSGKSLRAVFYKQLYVLRYIAVALLILAAARPGKGVNYSSVNNKGIDIVVVLDVSISMLGLDFDPENRLFVAKSAIKEFISNRKTDKIGLIIFSGEPYLQCPLTIEYDMLKDLVDEVDFDSVTETGTAVGEAVAMAASRMMDSKSKSKVILLLTDGANNTGSIDPENSAKICKELGIKLYTVGIGSEGRYKIYVPRGQYKGYHILDDNFDEETLVKMADITGGKFYRAKTAATLWENIMEIDNLEKTEYDVKTYHEFYDRFEYFTAAAFIIFLLEILLRTLYFRKLP